jgi:hypothetical protein
MSTHRPDDGGSKDLWNVGKLLPDYTVLQPIRQPSSLYVVSTSSDLCIHVWSAYHLSVQFVKWRPLSHNIEDRHCSWIASVINQHHWHHLSTPIHCFIRVHTSNKITSSALGHQGPSISYSILRSKISDISEPWQRLANTTKDADISECGGSRSHGEVNLPWLITLKQRSTTFSIPRAALAIHILVQGSRKKLMSWTVSKTVFFNIKSFAGIHLKTDNSCVSPYNWVYCKDVIS